MTTTTAIATDRLRTAADAIATVVAQLDTTSDPCECCGLLIYNNRDQARAHEQLERLPEKLRQLANRLDNAARRDAAKEGK